MSERRITPRHRVFKAGSIEFGGGAAIDCTIRNLSDSGAALDVASPIGIPDSFDLVLARDAAQQDQERRRCRVAWRKEKRIGVVFDAAKT